MASIEACSSIRSDATRSACGVLWLPVSRRVIVPARTCSDHARFLGDQKWDPTPTSAREAAEAFRANLCRAFTSRHSVLSDQVHRGGHVLDIDECRRTDRFERDSIEDCEWRLTELRFLR